MPWTRANLWTPLDASLAIVRVPDGLAAATATGPRWRAAVPALHDAVVVGDELWTCEGDRFARRRLGDGEITATLDHPAATADGFLIASAWAPGLAVWNRPGAPPLALVDDGGELAIAPVPGASDLAMPVKDELILCASRGVVELRGPRGAAWVRRIADDALELVAAGVVADGQLIALVLRRAGVPVLVTIGSHDGVVRGQLPLKGARGAAWAIHRGHAAITLDRDRLALIDLRAAEVLRECVVAADDVALDGAGARVVLARGGLVQWRTRHELESGAAPAPPVTRRPTAPAPVAAAPAPAPAPAALPDGPFLALAVAPILVPTTAAESTAILDAHVQVIGAHAYAALARAWDSGRISTPLPTDVPFFAEARGLLGIDRGHLPAAIDAATTYLDATVARLRERCAAAAGRRWPLAILRGEFGLSPLAAEILMVAAAPVLMGELARVYGIVANDPGRAVCDELMVCQLLAGAVTRDQIAGELDRDRPLRRHGLILDPPGGERPFQALRVDPLVLRRLRAQALDHDLDGGAVTYVATRPLGGLRLTAPDLDASLRRLESRHDPERPVRIAVRGRVGTGRRSLIAALAATVGRAIVVIDAASFPPAERAIALHHALRRAALRGFVPLVEGLDDAGDEDRRSQRGLADVFRGHPGPLALRLHWDTPVPLAPGYVQIDLGTPSEGDRTQTLVAALAHHGLVAHGHTELASRYRVGPGVLERVVTDLARTRAAAAIDPQHDATDELGGALRQHITSRLGATATRVARLAGWSDIVLPDDVIDSLREFVARVRHRRTVYETWGYDRKLTSARGVTALFTGSPGTGKTLVASAIAKDLGLDLYRVDLARVVSKWIGETERNLASVFDAAEDGQAIVLFDEADSLFTKRTEVKSSVDRYANLEVNYLLQRLDTFEGIAILTTNFGGGIDAAFKRRLSFRLTFPFPDEELRERLWRIHVPPEVPRAGELDFVALAERYRLSGGYIRNAAVRAAFLAASEGAGLGQGHLERAVALEYREIGKLVESGTLE